MRWKVWGQRGREEWKSWWSGAWEKQRWGEQKKGSFREGYPPSGPDATPVLQRQPRTRTRRWGHRDGTDILFTVVHLPPGSKWSHNHITHSQRPPVLQVQSHTHTFSFLCFFHTYSQANTQFHTRTMNIPINKSCHGRTDSGQIPAWLIYLDRKINTEYHRYTDDNMKNVPSLTSILSACNHYRKLTSNICT